MSIIVWPLRCLNFPRPLYGVTPSGNDYLGGLSYELSGGGYLIASSGPVPIPSAIWLFASGLIGLVGVYSKVSKG